MCRFVMLMRVGFADDDPDLDPKMTLQEVELLTCGRSLMSLTCWDCGGGKAPYQPSWLPFLEIPPPVTDCPPGYPLAFNHGRSCCSVKFRGEGCPNGPKGSPLGSQDPVECCQGRVFPCHTDSGGNCKTRGTDMNDTPTRSEEGLWSDLAEQN